MNKIIKNTMILTAITLVSGLLLGGVYEVTKAPIAAANEKAKKEAWQAVFPEADLSDFESLDVDESISSSVAESLDEKVVVDEVCQVGDLGYVITTTDSEGYGGDIQVTVGIAKDGSITGISILSISETAGLGMKAKEASFYEQYVGEATDGFYVSKDGGDGTAIDAISGATITSRAMTGAVNEALGYFKEAF